MEKRLDTWDGVVCRSLVLLKIFRFLPPKEERRGNIESTEGDWSWGVLQLCGTINIKLIPAREKKV